MNRQTDFARSALPSAAAAALLILTACGGGSDTVANTEPVCFDNAIYAENAVVKIEYEETGFATGSRSETSTVLSTNASFNTATGLVLREISRDEAHYRTSTAVYELPLSSGVSALYGTRGSGSVSAFGITTLTYQPPYEDRRATLAIGEEKTYYAIGTFERSTSLVPVSPPQAYSREIRVRFLGPETISLPAGTYRACRFEVSVDQGPTTTEWLYRSIVVRKESPTGADKPRVLEMQSGTLNGMQL